ncbi:hypothetical protein C1Y24_35150, partial [Pseudomonas sp. MPR-R2A4]
MSSLCGVKSEYGIADIGWPLNRFARNHSIRRLCGLCFRAAGIGFRRTLGPERERHFLGLSQGHKQSKSKKDVSSHGHHSKG